MAALNFNSIPIRGVREWLKKAFNVTDGHDHDGVNSKLITLDGAPAAGSLAATTGGRAIMATGYFNQATVNSKFSSDCIDNPELLKLIKDGAFHADQDTRALFEDGIWPLGKLAATARTHILSYQVEDLGAGNDISCRPLFFVPVGLVVELVSVGIIPQGTAAGVDNNNKSLIEILDKDSHAIASAEFDADPAFPESGVITDLGELDQNYKVLSAGEKILLSITNGATADLPAIMLEIVYTVSDAV